MGYRIGVSGSYGGMNLGDEAILEAILSELRSRVDAEVVVFSRLASDTRDRHGVRALDVPRMHRDEVVKELESLDLFVLGGGGLLFDGLADTYLRDVEWALDRDVPVMTYAISAGPLKAAETKQRVVSALNRVQRIVVREPEAKRLLHDLGVSGDIEVTGDPALLLEPREFTEEMLKSAGVDPALPLVGFSVREPGPAAPDLDVEHYHRMLAEAADFMTQRFDAQILFVPMERGEHKDVQHSHAVVARMASAGRARVLAGDHTSGQILGLVGRMEFVVGMRLHFLLFAAIQNVPFVPLPYASKVSGFLASLEMPVPALSDLNVGRLCATIDRSWDLRESTRQELARRVPDLQQEARRTGAILMELLAARPPRGAPVSDLGGGVDRT